MLRGWRGAPPAETNQVCSSSPALWHALPPCRLLSPFVLSGGAVVLSSVASLFFVELALSLICPLYLFTFVGTFFLLPYQ